MFSARWLLVFQISRISFIFCTRWGYISISIDGGTPKLAKMKTFRMVRDLPIDGEHQTPAPCSACRTGSGPSLSGHVRVLPGTARSATRGVAEAVGIFKTFRCLSPATIEIRTSERGQLHLFFFMNAQNMPVAAIFLHVYNMPFIFL